MIEDPCSKLQGMRSLLRFKSASSECDWLAPEMQYLVLSVLWIAWCVLHSAMISISVTDYLKRRWGIAFRFYRLTFNVVALLTLIPVAVYERSIEGHRAFWWQGRHL